MHNIDREIVLVPIEALTSNPENPRTITEASLQRLKNSIDKFREMLHLRPIVANRQGLILGGNQRYAACKALGIEIVPVLYADLTEEQEKQFIIRDNVSEGDWDLSRVSAWSRTDLTEWGAPKQLEIQDPPKQPKEPKTKLVTFKATAQEWYNATYQKFLKEAKAAEQQDQERLATIIRKIKEGSTNAQSEASNVTFSTILSELEKALGIPKSPTE